MPHKDPGTRKAYDLTHQKQRRREAGGTRLCDENWNKSQGHRDAQAKFAASGKHNMVQKKYNSKPSVKEARASASKFKEAGKKSTESLEINGNTQQITLSKTRIHTLEALLEYCEIDQRIWKVDRFVCNKWEVGAKGPDRDIIVEPLYQVKAWFTRNAPVEDAVRQIAVLKADAKKYSYKYPVIKRDSNASGNLLEINLTDHHFGKLAWGKETGWADYDLQLADEIWDKATDGLISRVSNEKFERIIFAVGNDLLHADNQANTTTSGTQLDVDSRYKKTVGIARRAIVRSIDKLLRIAPVRVIVIPGNHDQNAAWHMGESLECWYNKCKDVEIDNDPLPRKYEKWGCVMLMWTHGNQGKLSDYPQVMAVERPKMWGSTTIREAHTGDKHQRRLEEFHGVAVRILPALCAPDEWHSKKTFVGNIRSSEAYMWNKDMGLIGTATYTASEHLTIRN